MYIKYVIPFYYTLKTRITGKEKKIAYLFTFIFPVLIVSYLLNKPNFNFIIFLFGLLGLMSIYEIGYLRNDIITTKKERNPTKRLSNQEYLYVENRFSKILILKYLLFLVISLYLYFYSGANVIFYIINILLIEVFYYIHNRVRNRWNLISFFILSNLRYSTVAILFTDKYFFVHLVFLCTISILRLLEKASEKKYKFILFEKAFKNLNLARLIYYSILLVISTIIHYSTIITFLTLFFLVYRLGIYVWKRGNKI